jgi:3-oxoacyl-[acyl-carrier-protein] synthase III
MKADKTDNVYIGGFSYEVGEHEYGIERLRSLRGNEAQIQKFKEAGFARFRTSDLSIFELAAKCMEKLFLKVNIDPKEIDAFILATGSLGAVDNISHLQLCRFLLDNGLINAFPLVSSFSFCGNFLTAIHKGYHGIRAGDYKNVLVVTSDVISGSSTRIAPPDIAVGSDGACACLLSVNNYSGYELQSIHQVAHAAAGMLDPDKDFLHYTKAVGQGIREVTAKTFAKREESRKTITRVFTHNYSHNISRSYCRLVQIPESKAFTNNTSRYGHVCASDLCINLCDFLEMNGALQEPQEFLLLSTGPFMWGSALITAINN